MQKNNQSFIRAFIKFLKSKIDSKPTYEEITLLGIDEEEPKNGFKIKLKEREYQLRFYDSGYNNENASFINLRDVNRPKGKHSLIQYTIDNSNFIIEKNTFTLLDNRGITIETKKDGLKAESEKLMLDLGFEDKIILQGQFDNPDFDLISKSFFKWLRIRALVKLQLEEKYRAISNAEDENELDNIPVEVKVIYAYLFGSMSHRKIQREILKKDAPARGGGFLSMKILREYEIKDDKKGILTQHSLDFEIINSKGKYLEALKLLKQYYPELSNNNQMNSENIMSKNTILYGPPGTGKTYQMQQLIKNMNLIVNVAASQPDYRTFVSGYHWWELLALVLSDLKQATVPQMLAHELIKAKLAISNIQHAPQRLWSTLQHHTVENCPSVKLKNRHGELIFYKDEPSNWRLDNINEFKNQFPYLIEEWELFKTSEVKESIQKNYVFTTCHQSLSYEDFIEGIKPVLSESERNDDIDRGIQYQIRKGIFYQACEKAAQLAGFSSLKDTLTISKEERKETFKQAIEQNKRYALFLDEINRTNVSAVFGELITLIEDDKRLGGENEIADTMLPYSQTLFGVPANLFIIGTMNTADRSVEALDTALRRRFVFEQMLPDASLLSPQNQINRLYEKHPVPWDDKSYRAEANLLYLMLGIDISFEDLIKDNDDPSTWNEDKLMNINLSTFTGINLEKLLTQINLRIRKLLDTDHQIGHAFFMDVFSIEKLYSVFYQKIIPQLQEYFYGDYGKIGLVLGPDFVKYEKVGSEFQFAKFEYEGQEDLAEKMIYNINHFQNESQEIDYDGFTNAIKNVYQ